MTFAYLITAHADTEVLYWLLKSLDDYCNDIYVHWDKKYEIPPNLAKCLHMSNLFIVKERYNVCWGDISQVQAEYALFKAAFRKRKYDYYHLMSASDMPIKSNSKIQLFFTENNGNNFIGFNTNTLEDRILYKHLRTEKQREWSALDRIVDSMYVRIQKVLNIKNKGLKNIHVKKGPNWVSVSDSFVSALLNEHDWVIKTFSRTRNPDEYYKQTIAYKCGFENTLYVIDDEYKGCMRYVDWKRGKPYCWQMCDATELLQSDYLFCRKIIDSELAKYLYTKLKEV